MEKIDLTSVSGKPLCVRVWNTENPRAVVQLVHGMAEHMGRYDRLAQALNGAGYAVVGHDHLGHGPIAKAEDHGWFGEKNGWNNLIEDMKQVTDYAKKRFPGLPLALLGHSMGSFAVREYLLRYGDGLSACVISGTGWYAPGLCATAKCLSSLCGVFGGWHKPAPLVNSVGFGSSNNAFKPARTPFDWLSRDEKEVDKYIADPLCGFLFTARGYYDMFDGLQGISRLSRLSAMPKSLPIYFLSGSMDPVGQQSAGVKTVAQQFRDAGMQDVTVKLYADGRHEMFNEINRGEVTADLIGWLDQKL
ncbi:MAG: lysophospholipase [Clostridia bacterium]|nr:lysophospholipase [Clostridia bacterium]